MSEWRLIKDEPPPENEEVIFWDSGYKSLFIGWKFMGEICVDKTFLEIDGCDCCRIRADINKDLITHWMPKPSEPK
jgi:hypothetical protein